MTSEVITVTRQTAMQEARNLMRENEQRGVPLDDPGSSLSGICGNGVLRNRDGVSYG